MGILAEIFVAAPDDAANYAEFMLEGEPPADRFDYEQFKGFTHLELAILWAMIDGQEWNPDEYALEIAFDPEVEFDSWLMRFPTVFVDRLAALSVSEINRLSVLWAGIEELQWPAEDAELVLTSIVRLARLAREKGRGLFLWGAL